MGNRAGGSIWELLQRRRNLASKWATGAYLTVAHSAGGGEESANNPRRRKSIIAIWGHNLQTLNFVIHLHKMPYVCIIGL